MHPPTEQTLEQILVDCLHRIDRGERLDLERLTANHPELAEELVDYFESADLVQQWAGPTHWEHAAATASIDTSRIIDQGVDTLPLDDPDPKTSGWELPYDFGRYRLLDQLGAGAMGSVYLAYDTRLERNVAIKIPRQKFQPGSESHLRFEREARAAAAIQHRNICPVHDIGEIEGIQYIAMSFVAGRTLADRIREGDRNLQESVQILKKLAEALSLAHKRNVIHRDLKPANVILDDEGEPVITDFGLALQSDTAEHSRVTQHGTIVGTPAYMAPEQIDPDLGEVGPASEIYSLGVIFYELLTGRLPFEGSLRTLMNQVLTKSPKHPRQFDSTIPKSIDKLCLKMLEKTPADRFDSMEAILEELDRIETGQERRTSRVMTFVTTGILLALVPLAYWVWNAAQPTPSSETAKTTAKSETPEESQPAAETDVHHFQFQRSLLGHEGPIQWIAYSPDGKKAASCSGGPEGDRTIRIWDLERYKTEKVLKGHTAGVMSVAFSPNGSRLASADERTGLLVWDAATGQQLHALEKTAGRETVVFLDEKRFAISSSSNSEVQIWNAERGTRERSISLAAAPRQIDYHPRVRRIAAALESGQVVLIDPEEVESTKIFPSENSKNGPTNCVAFAPDGKRVVAGFEKQIRIWDIKSGQSLAMSQPRESKRLAFTPDGQFLINLSVDGDCELFATATGTRLAYQKPPVALKALAISPDGKTMLCGGAPKDQNSRDYAVQVIGLRTKQPKSSVVTPKSVPRLVRRFEGHTTDVHCLVFSPDGKTLASCPIDSAKDASIRFWDVATGKQTASASGHTSKRIKGAFTPDGKRFLSGDMGQRLILWDVATAQEVKRIQKEGGLQDLCVLTNRYACTVGEWDKKVRLWDLETGQVIKHYPMQHGGWARLGHDFATKRLMVANEKAEVKILASQNFSELARFRVSDASKSTFNSAAALSPDGKIVALSWQSDGVLAWDAQNKELLHHWKSAGASICLRFTPDNRWLLRADYSGDVHAFDTRTGKTTTVVHAGMTTFAFDISPDGKFIALGGHNGSDSDQDYAIQLWQLPESLWPKPLPRRDADPKLLVKLEEANDKTMQTHPVPTAQARREAAQRRGEAQQFFAKQDYEKAIPLLDKAIELDPQNAEAYFLRAQCSLKDWNDPNQRDLVLRYLGKAIERDPKRVDYLGTRAELYRGLSKTTGDKKLKQKAIDDYAAALKINRDQFYFWFQKAWLEAELNQLAEADRGYRNCIDVLLKKKKRNEREQMHLAWSYLNNCDVLLRKGDIAAAMGMGDKAIQAAPQMPMAHYNRGRAYLAHYDLEKAKEAIDQALALSPGFDKAYLIRSRIHSTLEDPVSAWKDAFAAFQLAASNPNAQTLTQEAALAAGLYGRILGRHEQAMDFLQWLRKQLPQNALVLNSIANVWACMGDFEKAIETYDEALKSDPDQWQNLFDKSDVLKLMNKPGEAEAAWKDGTKFLDQLIAQEPSAFAYRKRGLYARLAGDLDQALPDYRKAVELDPHSPYASANLAFLLAAHPKKAFRDGKRALELAKQLSEQTSETGAFWLSVRAAAHAENGQFAEARDWQQRALKICPATEYADYADRLKLYEKNQPFRLDLEPLSPSLPIQDVVVPTEIPVKSFKSLQAKPVKEQTPMQIARQSSAIVLLKTEEGFGTGMILDPRGYVLTCAHVTSFYGTTEVHYESKGETHQVDAIPLAIDYRQDLALLKFEPDPQHPLKAVHLGFQNGQPVKVEAGSQAVVIGNPGDGKLVLTKTVLTGRITNQRQMLGDYVKRPYIQVGANVNGGCSGGPLFDDHGRVVGVVVMKSPNLPQTGFATPLDVIQRFLGIPDDSTDAKVSNNEE